MKFLDIMNTKIKYPKSQDMEEIEKLKREIRELQKKLEIIEIEKETIELDYTELLEKINLKIKKQCNNCYENGYNLGTCSK